MAIKRVQEKQEELLKDSRVVTIRDSIGELHHIGYINRIEDTFYLNLNKLGKQWFNTLDKVDEEQINLPQINW